MKRLERKKTGALGLLLAAIVVLPQTGRAQEAEPAQETPETEAAPRLAPPPSEAPEPTAPRLLLEPRKDSRPPLGLRLLAETGLGIATSGGGAILGLGGGIIGFCIGGRSGYYGLNCLVGASLSTLLGAGLAFPLGIWMGGELTGGNGRLLLTYAGAAAGMVVGTLGIIASQGNVPISAVSLLLPLAGGLLGYELSCNPQRQDGRKVIQIQPAVSLAPSHYSLGLAGRF